MNSVSLVGRLTRDPEVITTQGGTHVAKFTLAIDRIGGNTEQKKTDFPRIVCFGKQAENVGKMITKGRQVAIEGRIQTGSYEGKDGKRVYTTDVVADRIEFLGSKADSASGATQQEPQYEGFYEYSDDDDNIPF